MDVVDVAGEERRSLPELDETSRPFWEAAGRGELLIQQCPACGHRQFYPRPLCLECGSTPEWVTAGGGGAVHTFTIIRQNGAPAFREATPYVVAIIELDEGVHMMGNLRDCDPESVSVGMRVEAFAEALPDGLGLVQWRPAS